MSDLSASNILEMTQCSKLAHPLRWLPVENLPKELGAPVKFTEFEDFEPSNSINKFPLTPKAKKALEILHDDYKIDDKIKFKELILEIAQKLGVKDIQNISAKRALMLCFAITSFLLRYDYLLCARGEEKGEFDEKALNKENDPEDMPLVKKIRENPEEAYNYLTKHIREVESLSIEGLIQRKQGVCRHYTQVMQAVFDTMKDDLDIPSLRNIYLGVTTHPEHIWNIIVEAKGNSSFAATFIDPTEADDDGQRFIQRNFEELAILLDAYDKDHLIMKGLLDSFSSQIKPVTKR